MNELYLLIGMVFMVGVATLLVWKEFKPVQKIDSTIQDDIKRSWEEYQRNKPPITLNEKAAGNE